MMAELSVNAVKGSVGFPLARLGSIGNESSSLGEGSLRLGNKRRPLALSTLLEGEKGSLFLMQLLNRGSVVGNGLLEIFLAAALPERGLGATKTNNAYRVRGECETTKQPPKQNPITEITLTFE
jgi:hypothetical protein